MDTAPQRLTERLEIDGPLGPDAAARLLLPVAQGLVADHARGVVHGAVSPSSIFIGADQVARLLPRTEVVPDPTYSPPGPDRTWRPLPADDVWSFGAVLVAAASGAAPPLAATARELGWLAPLVQLASSYDDTQRPTMAEVADYLRAPAAPAGVAGSSAAPPPRRTALLAGGIVLLLAALGAALLFLPGGDDADAPTAGRPGSSAPNPPSSTSSPTATASAQSVTAAQLEAFARDYVRTASTDPAAGFRLLTPEYQGESPRYTEVWSAIESPRILSVSADPATLSVSYRYRYRLAGRSVTEDVTLRLVDDGDSLLIAGATARPV